MAAAESRTWIRVWSWYRPAALADDGDFYFLAEHKPFINSQCLVRFEHIPALLFTFGSWFEFSDPVTDEARELIHSELISGILLDIRQAW